MEWFALKLPKSRSVNQMRVVGKGVFGTGAMWEIRVTCSPQGERPFCEGMGSGELCLEMYQGDRDGTAAYFKRARIKKPLDGALGAHPLGHRKCRPGDLAKEELNHKISLLD